MQHQQQMVKNEAGACSVVPGTSVDSIIKDSNLEFCFDGKFNTSYQRNNKTGGKKHLRCFPCCGPDHKSSRACEVALRVRFANPNISPQSDRMYIALARFLPLNEDGKTVCEEDLTDRLGDIELGTDITTERIAQFERSPDAPFEPLYSAKLVQFSPSSVLFEFRERAWHYGWKGGRYKQSTEHLLRVYVLEGSMSMIKNGKLNVASNEPLRCIAKLSSPSFTVYSSRSAPSKTGKQKEALPSQSQGMHGGPQQHFNTAIPRHDSHSLLTSASRPLDASSMSYHNFHPGREQPTGEPSGFFGFEANTPLHHASSNDFNMMMSNMDPLQPTEFDTFYSQPQLPDDLDVIKRRRKADTFESTNETGSDGTSTVPSSNMRDHTADYSSSSPFDSPDSEVEMSDHSHAYSYNNDDHVIPRSMDLNEKQMANVDYFQFNGQANDSAPMPSSAAFGGAIRPNDVNIKSEPGVQHGYNIQSQHDHQFQQQQQQAAAGHEAVYTPLHTRPEAYFVPAVDPPAASVYKMTNNNNNTNSQHPPCPTDDFVTSNGAEVSDDIFSLFIPLEGDEVVEEPRNRKRNNPANVVLQSSARPFHRHTSNGSAHAILASVNGSNKSLGLSSVDGSAILDSFDGLDSLLTRDITMLDGNDGVMPYPDMTHHKDVSNMPILSSEDLHETDYIMQRMAPSIMLHTPLTKAAPKIAPNTAESLTKAVDLKPRTETPKKTQSEEEEEEEEDKDAECDSKVVQHPLLDVNDEEPDQENPSVQDGNRSVDEEKSVNSARGGDSSDGDSSSNDGSDDDEGAWRAEANMVEVKRVQIEQDARTGALPFPSAPSSLHVEPETGQESVRLHPRKSSEEESPSHTVSIRQTSSGAVQEPHHLDGIPQARVILEGDAGDHESHHSHRTIAELTYHIKVLFIRLWQENPFFLLAIAFGIVMTFMFIGSALVHIPMEPKDIPRECEQYLYDTEIDPYAQSNNNLFRSATVAGGVSFEDRPHPILDLLHEFYNGRPDNRLLLRGGSHPLRRFIGPEGEGPFHGFHGGPPGPHFGPPPPPERGHFFHGRNLGANDLVTQCVGEINVYEQKIAARAHQLRKKDRFQNSGYGFLALFVLSGAGALYRHWQCQRRQHRMPQASQELETGAVELQVHSSHNIATT